MNDPRIYSQLLFYYGNFDWQQQLQNGQLNGECKRPIFDLFPPEFNILPRNYLLNGRLLILWAWHICIIPNAYFATATVRLPDQLPSPCQCKCLRVFYTQPSASLQATTLTIFHIHAEYVMDRGHVCGTRKGYPFFCCTADRSRLLHGLVCPVPSYFHIDRQRTDGWWNISIYRIALQ